ncbi:hypothetical protein TNCV_4678451 [Trichonephila clavipes]|nr:hypothetical protein TNCV_4678451 [Trichonephila clavipes]
MFFGQPASQPFPFYVNNTGQKPVESNGYEYLNPLQDRAALFESILKFLVTDLIILNRGQVMRSTPELATHSPNFHTMPTGGLSALSDLASINPFIWWFFSGIRLDYISHEFASMTNRVLRPAKF